jgi:hypothetical protein
MIEILVTPISSSLNNNSNNNDDDYKLMYVVSEIFIHLDEGEKLLIDHSVYKTSLMESLFKFLETPFEINENHCYGGAFPLSIPESDINSNKNSNQIKKTGCGSSLQVQAYHVCKVLHALLMKRYDLIKITKIQMKNVLQNIFLHSIVTLLLDILNYLMEIDSSSLFSVCSWFYNCFFFFFFDSF